MEIKEKYKAIGLIKIRLMYIPEKDPKPKAH